jgi:hypothetical protein
MMESLGNGFILMGTTYEKRAVLNRPRREQRWNAHQMPAPLVYNLGEHCLIITNDYGAPDAFELAAPVIDETETGEAAESGNETEIFDHDETYRLYQCLHSLFHSAQPSDKES